MLIFLAGLILFLGAHLIKVIAPKWRAGRIAAMGEGAWRGAYSLVSVLGLGLLIWGYYLANGTIGFLYDPPQWGRHATYILLLLAFIVFATSDIPAGRIKPLVRNPMLLGTVLWAAGHLLVRGNVISVLLFGSFLVWAIVDWISVSRRRAAGLETAPQPGPVKWDILALAAGVTVYLLFVFFLHEWLIGISPV